MTIDHQQNEKDARFLDHAYRRGFQHGLNAAIDWLIASGAAPKSAVEQLADFQNGLVTEFREFRGVFSETDCPPPRMEHAE
jgi:hypothetical protein